MKPNSIIFLGLIDKGVGGFIYSFRKCVLFFCRAYKIRRVAIKMSDYQHNSELRPTRRAVMLSAALHPVARRSGRMEGARCVAHPSLCSGRHAPFLNQVDYQVKLSGFNPLDSDWFGREFRCTRHCLHKRWAPVIQVVLPPLAPYDPNPDQSRYYP
jgi:hypothetical protein